MTDTPRKKLTLKRKPLTYTENESTTPVSNEASSSSRGLNSRLANKRIIRRDQLPADQLQKNTSQKPEKPPSPKALKSRPSTSATRPTTSKSAEPTPSKLQIHALNQYLIEQFPVWSNYQPLAHGIEETIMQLANSAQLSASKRVIQRLLRMHCHHGKYLQNTLDGTQRVNLKGEAISIINDEEKSYAQRILGNREPY